jgi:hypothetical protein
MKQFNLETQAWEEEAEELTVNSLELLQSIYRDCKVPLSRRMRAAMAALPFESPKLAVTTNLTNEGFAILLEKAVARSRAPLVIDHQPNEGAVIEARPVGIRGRSGDRG